MAFNGRAMLRWAQLALTLAALVSSSVYVSVAPSGIAAFGVVVACVGLVTACVYLFFVPRMARLKQTLPGLVEVCVCSVVALFFLVVGAGTSPGCAATINALSSSSSPSSATSADSDPYGLAAAIEQAWDEAFAETERLLVTICRAHDATIAFGFINCACFVLAAIFAGSDMRSGEGLRPWVRDTVAAPIKVQPGDAAGMAARRDGAPKPSLEGVVVSQA